MQKFLCNVNPAPYITPLNSGYWLSLGITIIFPRMTKKSRPKHGADFKAKMVLEAVNEVETLSRIFKYFVVHPQMMSNWKREFNARSSKIFSTKAPDEEAA